MISEEGDENDFEKNSLNLIELDINFWKKNLEIIFFTAYNITLIKDMLMNLKLGYF